MLRQGRKTIAAVALVVAALTPSIASAQDRVIDRFALRLEGAVGAMLSPFQRNDDGSAYDGNAKGFRAVAAQGSARLAVTLLGPVAAQVSIANWAFPSTTGADGLGVRADGRAAHRARVWARRRGSSSTSTSAPRSRGVAVGSWSTRASVSSSTSHARSRSGRCSGTARWCSPRRTPTGRPTRTRRTPAWPASASRSRSAFRGRDSI